MRCGAASTALGRKLQVVSPITLGVQPSQACSNLVQLLRYNLKFRARLGVVKTNEEIAPFYMRSILDQNLGNNATTRVLDLFDARLHN